MLKRLLTLLTALSLSLGTVTFVRAEENVAEPSGEIPEPYVGFGYEHDIKSEEPMVMLDFEKYNMSRGSRTGFSSTTGMPFPNDDMNGGTSMGVGGASRPSIDFEEPINSGFYLFSFDFRRSKPADWMYIRFNWNSGTMYDSFGIYAKNAGYNSNWNIPVYKECAENEWHHVNMYMDMDKRRIYYYVDNEYVTASSGVPEINKIQFMIEGTSDQITSLDNVTLFKFSTSLRAELSELGMEMPEDFMGDFLVDVDSVHDGNLFNDFDELELNINVTNKLDDEQKYDLSYYAAAYDGDIVWSGEEKGLTIGANEKVVHKVKPQVDRYDIYTLYTTVTSYNEGSEPVKKDKEFSVAHTPSPGYKSDFIGACTHPGRWTIWERVRWSIDISGIGYLRTDAGWGSYEREKGTYGGKFEAENRSKNFYREAASDGLNHILIFYPDNGLYGSNWKERCSPENLAALEKAAENVAREYKGIAEIFELGNEYNFSRIEHLSPETYATISATAYRGIKKGNPDAIVLSQGFSRNAADWIYRYLTATDEPVCDAVAVHLYQEAGTPETKNFYEYCMEVKNMMERAGYPDMELWMTEGNTAAHREYSTEQQHGVNLVRQFAYCQAYDLLDKFIFYQYQTDEARPNDIESYFGIMRGPNVNNANGPKQTYMALTNFLAMTENAVHNDLIQYDNVYIHKYKRSTDGKNILMMYADRDCKITSLDLSASSGTLYDVNGNTVSLKSADGKYVFSLADQPIYFEYDGDKFERCDSDITLDKNILNVTEGTIDDFNLTVPENAQLTVTGNDKLAAEVERDGSNAKVKVTVQKMPTIVNKPGIGNVGDVDYTERRNDFGTQLYRDYIDVTIKQNGNQSAVIKLPVEYKLKPANIKMKVRPYDNTSTKYWVGVVEIHNNTSKTMSGTVKITQPNEMKDITVSDIAPGKTKMVEYNIPAEYCSGYHMYGGTFTTQDGEELEFVLGDWPESFHFSNPYACAFGVVEKTKNQTPVIDGIIDEAEWKEHKITNFDKSAVSYGSQGIVIAGVVEGASFGKDADYGGKADFSGTIYAQWDDKYFYTAAVVYDDVHWQKQDPIRFYYDDHFYLTLCPTHTQRHDTRIEFALSDFFNSDKYTDEDRHGKIYRNWSQMFGVKVGGVIPESEDGNQVKVVRKENVTIYEARILLMEMYSPEVLADKPIQSQLGFNIRDYDGDRDKTFGWGGWFALVDTKK